jgi:Zn-dependent membrane protease YugP
MQENYDSNSLTAVAIAAHEVGHAIQDHQGDKRLANRTKMIPIANMIARWSVVIISLSPIIAIIMRHPVPFSVLLFLGLSGFIARMIIHAVTLPIEFDASFSKALPILREGNYISQANEKAVSRILNAAALTYVSAALADILNLSRWLIILSRR